MTFLKFNYLSSILFLAILFLIQNAESKNKNLTGINPICKTVPNIRLCNRIVNGATNPRNGSINAIHAAINISKSIQKLTPLIAKEASDLDTAAKEALVKLCTEDFEDAIEELETGVRYINEGDINGADSYLAGAVGITGDCRDAVTERGKCILALNKIIEQFNKVMDTTLVLVHQIPV